MYFMLTMDQVKRLYEELVKYDPSLSQNKDAVLQLIEKMLDAKPAIVANPVWKEAFSEKLMQHIAAKKAFTPKMNLSHWLAKWSVSLATFRIAIFMVGAGYMRWSMGANPSQKQVKKQPVNLAKYDEQENPSDADTQIMIENINDIGDMKDSNQPTANTHVDAKLEGDVRFQNSSLALRNTQTI